MKKSEVKTGGRHPASYRVEGEESTRHGRASIAMGKMQHISIGTPGLRDRRIIHRQFADGYNEISLYYLSCLHMVHLHNSQEIIDGRPNNLGFDIATYVHLLGYT